MLLTAPRLVKQQSDNPFAEPAGRHSDGGGRPWHGWGADRSDVTIAAVSGRGSDPRHCYTAGWTRSRSEPVARGGARLFFGCSMVRRRRATTGRAAALKFGLPRWPRTSANRPSLMSLCSRGYVRVLAQPDGVGHGRWAAPLAWH